MTPPSMDWDSAYRQENRPPWSIGKPQPELATLIAEGKVRGEVLDSGCGEAELALHLASLGYSVVGLDSSPTSVSAAVARAGERGLSSVSFAVADITDFGGYDGRFATVMDSGLFHALPVGKRAEYLGCIARAAAPGASLYILSFATEVTDAVEGPGPRGARGVSAEEFRNTVAPFWVVDEVRPAYLYANIPTVRLDGAPAMPDMSRFIDGDQMTLPGFLLSAHKPA